MNAVSEIFRPRGFYWIALAGQEAEEACWDGSHWTVAGSHTRIVSPVLVLTPRTAALPAEALMSQFVGNSSH